ncbi:MAG: ATP-binding cassette domain-containing protein [Candidatus Portiera sp.]|nr:ATP-binding cassette domain-containing protein [Portiera sp.]
MRQKYSLELRDVSIALDGNTIVGPLSFKIKDGDVVTIMGASGSGKSSLLNFICGNLPNEFSQEGRVLLNDNDITETLPEKRQVGILFQDDLLFPHMSVGTNLAFSIPQGIGRKERQTLVEKALADAGMSGFGSKDPATLSGGQRSRISLMRALLAKPQAILLDEPFNKLDSSLRQKLRQFVFSHTIKAKIPCVLVTHDIEDAKAAKGKIINLGIQ